MNTINKNNVCSKCVLFFSYRYRACIRNFNIIIIHFALGIAKSFHSYASFSFNIKKEFFFYLLLPFCAEQSQNIKIRKMSIIIRSFINLSPMNHFDAMDDKINFLFFFFIFCLSIIIVFSLQHCHISGTISLHITI